MISILCYGDSNTYGLKSDLKTRYSREERWTGVLQERLGKDYYVIEEGLGGRTTVWDDPIEDHKNGKKYLAPCLDSHKPLDLVIIMLGTNDLKERFSVTSYDVSLAMENLIQMILKSDAGIDFQPPKILLITPVPVISVGNKDIDSIMLGADLKSRKLIEYYENIAKQYSIYHLDPSDQVEINQTDGVHYTAKGHREMAVLIEEKVRDIFKFEL